MNTTQEIELSPQDVEVQALIGRARAAQQILVGYSQEQVN
jgi:hypothetical protein